MDDFIQFREEHMQDKIWGKKSLFTDIVHKYYGESFSTTISALSILDCLRNWVVLYIFTIYED